MKIHDTGCPICGEDISGWSLVGQEAHVYVHHSLWQRLRLFWQTRQRLHLLLAERRYHQTKRLS